MSTQPAGFPAVAEGFSLPEGFRFGVATAGFQIEGGYNGPGQPANNWFDWERKGRVERSGEAIGFWEEWPQHLDRAKAAGCDAFRLSIEWARCEPEEGQIDGEAFDRYAAILAGCRERGLEPLVTLHHFTHPRWLGQDFWLDLDSPERFAAWVTVAVERLADRCHRWVTLNEVNVLATQTWLTGMFPPGHWLDIAAYVRTLDHLVTAHVLAYEAIHRIQPGAVVSTNNYCLTVYELDRLVLDLLLARSRDIDRADLDAWLAARRGAYHERQPWPSPMERAVRRLAASRMSLEKGLPRAVAAVYASPHPRTLDVMQLDYYDPLVSRHLRLPGHRTAGGGRNWLPGRMLWDDEVDPDGLVRFGRLNHEPGLDLWVVENGLCNRVVDGRAYPRLDGWERVRYLRENLAAVVRAIESGLPITAYFHWTLADNYEWGSYEPRFGLYGVDRRNGPRWLDHDSMGGEAAAAYRRIIEGLRAGDLSVVGR